MSQKYTPRIDQRWIRHDWRMWIRPDFARWLKPGVGVGGHPSRRRASAAPQDDDGASR